MGLTDATLLHDSSDVEVRVEPVVLFSIVDHYSRRNEGQPFVIGTLLGTDEGGVVTICSSFAVPHHEVEGSLALATERHATMLSLQQRVLPKQVVVGWYSTGEQINENTLLINNFYGQDVERPVHLLLDLGLGDSRMSTKAYVASGLTLGSTQLGTAFREIRLSIVNGESDRVGIDNLLKMSTGASGVAAAASGTELDSVESTVKKLLRNLEDVVSYVDKVKNGSLTAEPEVVHLLQQLVAAAPRLPTESFEKMFNTQVQDMLTIVYLANLTRTQLALAEKLQAVALNSDKS
uniref:MPN domain-containing protein n=1 Tax=Haptolina brevifila TaxID=156173 RepID=A0A7S2B6V4_9EUKA|mmetsp:Transcript_10167/g.20692  ORF Transcript_10167/g.20692 Transcript_10167/m.20692 type:complete len:292 (+) Transcript_10167:65-940(+)